MKILSLLAGIVLLLACFFEIGMFANDIVGGNISLTDPDLASFYSPIYMLVDAVLAAWFFVDFATRD